MVVSKQNPVAIEMKMVIAVTPISNAFIYQELAPAFADYFIEDFYDMAHSRKVPGVHYSSDSHQEFLRCQFVISSFENSGFREV